MFEYDSVINTQREKIYGKRDAILASETSPENQQAFVEETITELKQYINDIIVKQVSDAEQIGQSVPELLAVISRELGISFDQ